MGERGLSIHIVQGIVAILVATITAFGGYWAGKSRIPIERSEAKITHGLLLSPPGMRKTECAMHMIAALASSGNAVTDNDSDAGKRVEGRNLLGFWCAKQGLILYYGVAPTLDEAIKQRRIVKAAALSIGATKAPEEP